MESKTARIRPILAKLKTAYPEAAIPLKHRNPFELLVATILSAQCTDERVNQVTPALFKRYPDARALASATPSDLEALIRSTGFYHNKAKSLLGMSRLLADRFGGQVPRRMEDLLELPGVARKTANVVLGGAFGISVGVVVDTHVKRLAQRLGLTRQNEPEKIERELMELVPAAEWYSFSLRLIYHGRRVCKARKPNCAGCTLSALCPSAFKV
jgi:endonuclease III